jgi:hypothetical protein
MDPVTTNAVLAALATNAAAGAGPHPAFLGAVAPLWKFFWYFQVVGTAAVAAWIGTLTILWRRFGRKAVARAAALCAGSWALGILFYSSSKGTTLVTTPVNLFVQQITFVALLALTILALRHDRRVRAYRAVAAAAWLALGLARWNSHQIDAIQIDDTDERTARKDMLEPDAAVASATGMVNSPDAATPPAAQTNAPPLVGLVPASPPERPRTATNDTRSIYERAAAGELDAQVSEAEPLYKREGLKLRNRGKSRAGVRSHAAAGERVALAAGRRMNDKDKYAAVAWDKVNVFAARLVVLIAVVVLFMDYLRRFNSTFSFICPLPLASPTLDRLTHKAHTVRLPPEYRASLPAWLGAGVRKGETFIYFGDRSPFRDGARLARLHVPGGAEILAAAADVLDRSVAAMGLFAAAAAPVLPATANRSARLRSALLGWSRRAAGHVAWAAVHAIRGTRRLLRALRVRGRQALLNAGTRFPLDPAGVALLRTALSRRGAQASGAPLWSGRALSRRVGLMARCRHRLALSVAAAVEFLRRHRAGSAGCDPVRPPRLTRLLRNCAAAAAFVRTQALCALTHGWDVTLRVKTYSPARAPDSSAFVFESAWFGRYAFCVEGPHLSGLLIRDLCAFLESRVLPKARARRTVNIVWDVDAPLGTQHEFKVMRRCAAMNYRWVRVTEASAAGAAAYEEQATCVDPDDLAALTNLCPTVD